MEGIPGYVNEIRLNLEKMNVMHFIGFPRTLNAINSVNEVVTANNK